MSLAIAGNSLCVCQTFIPVICCWTAKLPIGTLIAAHDFMFYATKGPIRLEIKLNDELTIVPITSSDRFEATANVIAKSHGAILNSELRSVPAHEKAQAIKDYFKRNGWEVGN